MDRITMAHGSGGSATSELIHEIFEKAFSNHILNRMEDAAVVEGCGTIAITTDSFVVTPLFFPNGDIGRLCICGTINDLLSRGAVPKYITCGFIIEEGADAASLRRIAESMRQTADEAGVLIVAGDTKVIEGSGGIYINTSGVGYVPEGLDISAENAKDGDAILVTGNLGDHHAALLAARLDIETDIESDNAPLGEIVDAVRDLHIHTLRDITRGGLATVLKELAQSSGHTFFVDENSLPVDKRVSDFCGILGLDPLYMGNEGKMAVILPADEAGEALERISRCRYGKNAAIIGEVKAPKDEGEAGELYSRTSIGGLRRLTVLQGEGLPRIC